MKTETFTREEVIKIIDDLLQRPDLLMDAMTNEQTDYDAGDLFDMAIYSINNKKEVKP
mgnify:CR=1 FL=1